MTTTLSLVQREVEGLGADVHLAIQTAKLPLTSLTSVTALSSPPDQTILVDHNAVEDGSPFSRFSGATEVVGVVDHHADSGLHRGVAGVRVVERAGSCASLVARECFRAGVSLPPSVMGMLLSAIRIDTGNLEEPSRTTEVDREMARALAEAGAGEFAVGFEALARARFEGGAQMAPEQALAHDRKAFKALLGVYGISSITQPLSKFFAHPDATAALSRATAEGGLLFTIVLAMFKDAESGEHRREICVDGPQSQVAVAALERIPGLAMTELFGSQRPPAPRCFSIASSFSRKVLQPLFAGELQRQDLSGLCAAIPEFSGGTYDFDAKFDRAWASGTLWARARPESGSFVAAYERDGNFYIWLLGVVPSGRRTGQGLSLLAEAEAEGKARNPASTITIKTDPANEPMKALLSKAGFKQQGTGRLWTKEAR